MTRYAIPGTWADNAACRGRTDEFEVESSTRGAKPPRRSYERRQWDAKIDAAKQVCWTCPSLRECRRWAMSNPDPADGFVAGGLSPEERRTRRRGLRVVAGGAA